MKRTARFNNIMEPRSRWKKPHPSFAGVFFPVRVRMMPLKRCEPFSDGFANSPWFPYGVRTWESAGSRVFKMAQKCQLWTASRKLQIGKLRADR